MTQNKSLTQEQSLRAAVAAICDNVDYMVIASIFGVNQGRVAEAVSAIRWALENRRTAYSLSQGKLKVVANGVEVEDKEQPGMV